MANSELSKGAFAVIMNGGEFANPVVQVLTLKKMNANSNQPEKDRYRCFLSDGLYTISFAMMAAAVHDKGAPNGLKRFSVIKITRYITSVINNTGSKSDSRVLLVLDMELLRDGDAVGDKIGNPVPYSEAAVASVKRGNVSSDDSPQRDPPSKVPRLMNGSGAGAVSDSNVSLGGSGQITHPIASLSPYHNRWVIKVRVSNKSSIRTWSNSKGDGKLFNVDLVDESGEIRLTFFRDLADKFYDQLQVDKVYYISKCQLKTANKQFNSLKNDYEMTAVPDTIVEECVEEDVDNIPHTQYNFTPIARISQIEVNSHVDVIGVAKSASDLQTFQAKSTGRELRKREVTLVDETNSSVSLTLWGAEADTFDVSSNPVVVIKGAKVTEFGGGKNLSVGIGSQLRINPDLKECYRLKGWFESEGRLMEPTNISSTTGNFQTPWMSFKQVIDQQLGQNDRGDYYQVKGTVLLLRSENCAYKACPQSDCNKKVNDMNNGYYRCEKCNKEYPEFKWRLMGSMNVGDWSGNQWVSMFNDEAEKIIGKSARDVGEILEAGPSEVRELMNQAHFKEFILKCRAKVEMFNDEARLKTVVVKADPINYEEYNAYLISSIKQLANIND
ncbi:replication protein A 70 kDa DNA-binding subunit [Cylas formicarius]|uniref:replication protein A 70 kDa DNA-binding subunit n=1 Tax=Cylas formicarius TaxID=197179 RepID=UPI002958A1BC|nr:replication protein A 70 kDa DNA-binding subunit [Cylas formicarius]